MENVCNSTWQKHNLHFLTYLWQHDTFIPSFKEMLNSMDLDGLQQINSGISQNNLF